MALSILFREPWDGEIPSLMARVNLLTFREASRLAKRQQINRLWFVCLFPPSSC
jgi:hypothetical protein